MTLDLFTPTSRAAYESIDPATLRAKVLAHIRSQRQYGATDEEAQDALGMNPSTQRPRRIELERAALVTRDGCTRPTRSGRQALVFVAKEWA